MNSIETQSPSNNFETSLGSNAATMSDGDQAALIALQKLIALGGRPTADLLAPTPTAEPEAELPEGATTPLPFPLPVAQPQPQIPTPEVKLPEAKLPEVAQQPASQPSLLPTPPPVTTQKTEIPVPQTVPVNQQQPELDPTLPVIQAPVHVATKLVQEQEIKQPNAETMGDEILQAFGAQSSNAPAPLTSPNVVQAAPSVDVAARIETFINQITERILVTDPLSGQNAQVHIKIADHVLPGTELQIWRGENNQLNIHFATAYAQSASLLADASAGLAQRLNDRLSLALPVVVTVQTDDRGGMPQDGRSRQYQSVYDLLAQTQGD